MLDSRNFLVACLTLASVIYSFVDIRSRTVALFVGEGSLKDSLRICILGFFLRMVSLRRYCSSISFFLIRSSGVRQAMVS